MADDQEDIDVAEDEDVAIPQSAEAKRQATEMNKVAAMVAEREVDAAALQDAMSALHGNAATDVAQAAAAERERHLATVVVAKEDVDLVMAELEMDKADADRALRQHDGDLETTLLALIRGTAMN